MILVNRPKTPAVQESRADLSTKTLYQTGFSFRATTFTRYITALDKNSKLYLVDSTNFVGEDSLESQSARMYRRDKRSKSSEESQQQSSSILHQIGGFTGSLFQRKHSGVDENPPSSKLERNVTESTIAVSENDSSMDDSRLVHPPLSGLQAPSTESESSMVDTSAGSISTASLAPSEATDDEFDAAKTSNKTTDKSFVLFRLSYLFVTIVVMLADGLQGE